MEFLQTLTTLGAGFKSLLGDCLSSKSIYDEACRPSNCKNKKYEEFVAHSQEMFVDSIATVEKPAFPHQLCADFPALADSSHLRHESMLDELMFWIVKFEFPQPLVTFLLTMLPDEAYKTAFTNSFIKHYSRMTMALAESGQPQVGLGRFCTMKDILPWRSPLALSFTHAFFYRFLGHFQSYGAHFSAALQQCGLSHSDGSRERLAAHSARILALHDVNHSLSKSIERCWWKFRRQLPSHRRLRKTRDEGPLLLAHCFGEE